MVGRFLQIYDPVCSALKKLNQKDLFNQLSNLNKPKLIELVKVLRILDTASRSFSNLNCNLQIAEDILNKFIIPKLDKINSDLSIRMVFAVKTRFSQRRSKYSQIINFLSGEDLDDNITQKK